MKFPGIIIGDTLTIQKTVSESDTSGNFLPADVEDLFSTPALVAMMMEASVKLVDERLPDGFISVGKSAEVTHDYPTVLGANITVKVEIKSFDGYHVDLKMTARDESGVIGRGTHTRSIVNKRWMQMKVQKRISSL